MKRCPKCYQPYSDSEKFCELDGQPLLVDVAVAPTVGKLVETEVAVQESSSQKRDGQVMVIVGVMVGMVLTSLGYAGYALFTAKPQVEERIMPVSKVETVDTRPPTREPRYKEIEPSPSPEEETSPSPEPEEETQAAPAAETNTMAARLNQGPVSTGERAAKRDEQAGDKTIIEMNDGTSIEVDAAWEDKQGIWYRRGGLVSFVESKRIKGIQAARQETKPESLSSPNP
jgi:hypothetical protein